MNDLWHVLHATGDFIVVNKASLIPVPSPVPAPRSDEYRCVHLFTRGRGSLTLQGAGQIVRVVLLVIDNYDSFTYNLVQYFGQLGVEQKVYRNDQITVEEALALNPDRVMISPGPCSPAEAGVSCAMIKAFAGKKPILGVCLGHQAIGHAFGGKVIRAPQLMHGKTSPVFHNDTDVFQGLPSPFAATRYHSLVVERSTFPAALEVTAWTDDGLVMGLRHRELPIWGVQFHPESFATEHGLQLLGNFLKL